MSGQSKYRQLWEQYYDESEVSNSLTFTTEIEGMLSYFSPALSITTKVFFIWGDGFAGIVKHNLRFLSFDQIIQLLLIGSYLRG